jgi:hypothetical protein
LPINLKAVVPVSKLGKSVGRRVGNRELSGSSAVVDQKFKQL